MGRNREIAEAAYGAINDRDFDGFIEHMHPDVEVRSLIAESEGRTYRGHAGAREWWESVAGSMGGLTFELQHSHESDEWLAVELRATGKIGGVDISQTMWQAIRFREGLGIWLHGYRTEAEALEATGIEA